eukprot:SAG31_NODE_95_length_25901_cov_24.763700_28_plen_69_part_00
MSLCQIATCRSENTIRSYDAHFATVWPDNTQLSGTIPDSLGLTALTALYLGEYMPDLYLLIIENTIHG